jgi:hypothetical protein
MRPPNRPTHRQQGTSGRLVCESDRPEERLQILAVGLGPVGAGELAGRAEVGQGLPPGEAFAVGPGVVGQDAFDAGDAVPGEECRGPCQEARAGGGLLVGVDLAVGEAAV